MCTRILYETGTNSYIVGRNMDWSDPTAKTRIWAFPRAMKRDGGEGESSLQWSSKYGSIVCSFYDIATADGFNEAGLAGNLLYLAESDFGDVQKQDKPRISVGAWLQYFLDNYKNVQEAVVAMKKPPFAIVAPVLPNGRESSVHLCISDKTGDSAIFEYIGSELKIHHGPQYQVMTNSPVYDEQLALNAYWELIGGDNMLPGTISAADRFVRASYFLKSAPKFEGRKLAVAAVFSQLRAVSVPLGLSDPEHPNISSTLWRTVCDQNTGRYYFDSAIRPALFWIDIDNFDLSPGSSPLSLDVDDPDIPLGEVSAAFKPAPPYSWLV